MSEPIKIWRFDEAPEEYRQMSEHGGDEDYIALVPLAYKHRDDSLVWKIEEMGLLGCCSTDRYEVDAGVVYIGAHA